MHFDHVSGIKSFNQQLTREENSKLLFNLINSGNHMTRAELVRITGLSASTVSSLVILFELNWLRRLAWHACSPAQEEGR